MLATFGAGCFWGVEHIFNKIQGVNSTRAGYLGGALENPTYEDVCTGASGHAEVVEIDYDENVVSYKSLLDYFWRLHDPTQLNRQGVDVGTQYRSGIYYHNEEQKIEAQESKDSFDKKNSFGKPSVTEIVEASVFYPAEEYHQGYYLKKYQGQEGPICHTLRDQY